jgi:RNA polymerase sigma factor (sigma-70 family)
MIDHEQARRDPRQRLSGEEVVGLMRRASAGDELGWARLVDEYNPLLWAVARAHRLRDPDAADVVQSTWLKLLEHLDDLHDPARVGAWLATTARRECLRVLRGAATESLLGDALPESPSSESRPGDELFLAERDKALWRAFERLRHRDRALLRLLMATPGRGYSEIAAALDMPIGSIGPTRARALERLRDQLSRDQTLTLLTA